MSENKSGLSFNKGNIRGNLSEQHTKYVVSWLYFLTLLVIMMVFIGGLTRLTDSGLSMTDWRPLSGWLPPRSAKEWMLAFKQYQASPEYLKINLGMSVDEFKGIFWLEYIHRLWGRLIGIAFIFPYVLFLLKGWISFPLGIRLFGLFILGGLQGVLGWYMVQSGLVDRPEVSQYRLAAHLGLALFIISMLFWLARGLTPSFKANWYKCNPEFSKIFYCSAVLLPALVFITVCSGGLVAGLNAGLAYNTFPLMGGNWIPEEILTISPIYLNFFENAVTVQFDHRILAILTMLTVSIFWLLSRRHRLPGLTSLATKWLLFLVFAQVGLGISTLIMAVPLSLALAHQACGVSLFICAVWLLRELTRPPRYS